MKELILGASGWTAEGVEFLGELDSSFMTYSTLSTTLGVTQGTLNTTANANKWLHFKLDDKELIVSKVAIRSAISWDHLYSKGLVYGTDDNGLYPTGTPTNQFKTITISDKTYKVRLLKGADPGNDPFSTTGYDIVGTQVSEWSMLFYPIITNDPNIKSYTGPMLASYLEADLQMRYVSNTVTPGSYNWCQESYSPNMSYRVHRGHAGPSYFSAFTSSYAGSNRGWRGCLELL